MVRGVCVRFLTVCVYMTTSPATITIIHFVHLVPVLDLLNRDKIASQKSQYVTSILLSDRMVNSEFKKNPDFFSDLRVGTTVREREIEGCNCYGKPL